jgi:phosphatidylglycerol lysyltransferase
MSVVLLVYSALRLLRPARVRPQEPTVADLETARAVLAATEGTAGNLALLGDKVLLFNPNRSAFLTYGVNGRSWVTMGDPVGPEAEWSDLLWTFQDLADDFDARCVFYEIGTRRLDLYLDLGMSLFKLGEEARVELTTFSLEGKGKEGSEFRRVRRNLEREGYSFRVLTVEETRSRIGELRRISDEWLAEKHVAEKGFSLGFFDEEYVASTPCAVIEKDGSACAFANLWLGGTGEELTVDLMRYTSDSPNGLMDYLFTSLMFWGGQNGYGWFSLGMAPLAGLDEYAPGSLWSATGRLVYRYGEHFYNFEGLRRYKDKFGPIWTPRYMACATAWQLPQALADVTVLVSGGLRKAILR